MRGNFHIHYGKILFTFPIHITDICIYVTFIYVFNYLQCVKNNYKYIICNKKRDGFPQNCKTKNICINIRINKSSKYKAINSNVK